jgi:hypothetical protein
LKNKKIIGGNPQPKCVIDETDTVLFGDGGSSSIIVLTKTKRVYKIFTLYKLLPDIDRDNKIKLNNAQVDSEIGIYKNLTEKIINSKISNHFVKYIGENDCDNAELLFAKCPKKYNDFLKMENKSKLCITYFRNHPDRKVNANYKVLEIEHCDYSCADFIVEISKLSTIEMEKYLDIFFFQIIYTILSTQKIFPYFIHNDLFIRNILGQREKDNGNYYTYKFENNNYFVPQKIFYPKINDFGYTNLNETYKDRELAISEYKDIYNLILDVYNGGNLGSVSLSELCKEDPNKMKFLKMYFKNYFNIDIIDSYFATAKKQMHWDWANILDNEFLASIEMKKPSELMSGYFYNIFGKINENLN